MIASLRTLIFLKKRAIPCSRTSIVRQGFSLIEIVLGLALFVLLFSHVMMALTPTATNYQGMVRGYTLAAVIGNWYINQIEGRINLDGQIPDSELGTFQDVTPFVDQHFGETFRHEFRDAEAQAAVNEIEKGLYRIEFRISWGAGRGEKKHHYQTTRLKSNNRL